MRIRTIVLVGLAAAALAPGARAQSLSQGPAEWATTADRPAGWSIRPSISVATVWDSNVLFDNKGDVPVAELVQMLRPRADLDYRGRRGEFGAYYRGAFTHHQDLRSLDSYDQRLVVSGERKLTRRATWFARYGATAAPTTELLELPGVPYERTGSRLHDAQTGFDLALTRRTSIGASYRYEHVWFDRDQHAGTPLVGGYSNGGSFSLRHAVTPRTFLTADYHVLFAALQNRDDFYVQTAWAGVEHELSDVLRVFGAGGVSRLSTVGGDAPRLGPSMRVGIARDFRRAGFSATYGRSYVPSYGFGGTMQNEELTARLLVPFGRKVYAHTSLSWRINEPLDAATPALRSTWFGAGVGYAFLPFMRLEAYNAVTTQNFRRPGGELTHYQFGLQVTAAKTARIR